MARYRKNKLRADIVHRFGQEVGLPLFEQSAIRNPQSAIIEVAPKAIVDARDTRKLAHMTVTADKVKLGERQRRVLEAFRAIGPASNEEVAHYLGWPINRVVGRSFELRQLGLLIAHDMRACKITGIIVHTWKAK